MKTYPFILALLMLFGTTARAGLVSTDLYYTAAARPDLAVYTVALRAFNHGVSVLHFDADGGVFWENVSGAAPGRWGQADDAPIQSYINGEPWWPQWPEPGENRCNGCLSSVGPGLVPVIAEIEHLVSLDVIHADGLVSIDAHPTLANDWNIALRFDDSKTQEARWVSAVVGFLGPVEPELIPLPPTPLLLMLGLAGLALKRQWTGISEA